MSLIASISWAQQTFEVCYNFSCRTTSQVTLSAEEWQSAADLFQAQSADDEREQIKLAIARMEQLAGNYLPTHRDIAFNLPKTDDHDHDELFPGQQDCIDESINTMAYLRLFEKTGLLRFHRSLDRAYRRTIWDQHWAAKIEEIESGQRFVIDSWFRDNGEPPYLVTSEQWHDLSGG